MAREWHYWTLNKLQILGDYLPAFNIASKKSRERIYLDLMAGQPENVESGTTNRFDGSVRLAMAADPPFTRLAFIEQNPTNAAALRADLENRHPGDVRGRVYAGDCNVAIDDALADLSQVRWAPTFAFIDQQSAEVSWSTIAKVSAFRTGKYKTEMWILMSPAMIAKGIKGTNGDAFAARVDGLYGNTEWRRIVAARDAGELEAEEMRDEMVNLFRWQMESTLNYVTTARIPMKMMNNTPVYDMVFATDHPTGLKIMSWLYEKAVAREPRMKNEVRVRALNSDVDGLFAVTGDMLGETVVQKWENVPAWDPESSSWSG
jgi:three-Cys-motif partner protein